MLYRRRRPHCQEDEINELNSIIYSLKTLQQDLYIDMADQYVPNRHVLSAKKNGILQHLA